jgi:hypothetical protein
MTVVTLVLAMITVTGIAYTDEFPQAARAEAIGFEALAHDLFDGEAVAAADNAAEAAK